MTVYRDNPRVPLRCDEDGWWTPHSVPGWVSLGYCPEPAGAWATFRYHVLHGLLTGYPLRSALVFAWRNRDSFDMGADQ